MSEYAQTGTPIPTRAEGEIAAAHRELESVVEDISTQLGRLTEVLDPVLRRSVPDIGVAEKLAEAGPIGVRVADDLNMQIDRLRGARNRLRDLTDRVAL